jgi:hypothetical protein
MISCRGLAEQKYPNKSKTPSAFDIGLKKAARDKNQRPRFAQSQKLTHQLRFTHGGIFA